MWQSKVSVKYSEENIGQVSYQCLFKVFWEGGTRKGVGAYFSLSSRGREVGWGWALIKFFCLQDGRLFEVGPNSRLSAYSNKYGMKNRTKARF